MQSIEAVPLAASTTLAAAAASGGDAIIKSPVDKRLYRYLTLPNGLVVLLISDPEMLTKGKAGDDDDDDMSEEGEEDDDDDDDGESEGDDEGDEADDMDDGKDGDGKEAKGGGTKKAAAAMCVGVGSFSDPADVQGLAHFLEHMLFMGSAAFPDENDYDAYLKRHGGGSNAFTEAEHTVFFFDVQPAGLRGALERFAQFFTAPLVKASAMEREVKAVDSEFQQVLQSDACRLQQLMCHTAPPGHPWRTFGWGNRASIVGAPAAAAVAAGVASGAAAEAAAAESVRGRLMSHYTAHYRADRSALVILGAASLDSLESDARELFAAVRPAASAPDAIPPATFAGAGPAVGGGTAYECPAVKDAHELHIALPLPCLQMQYASKAEDYVSHLVGHEGTGSLLLALKAKGWATALSAGVTDSGYERNTAGWLFTCAVTLTDAGLTHRWDVAALFFQYVALLRRAGPQEWVWRELQAMREAEFRYKEEEEAEDYVVRLASHLRLVAPPHALAADALYLKWDPGLVAQVLAALDPQAARIDVLSKDFRDSDGLDASEPWFGLKYRSVPLDASTLAGWANPASIDPLLALPPPNAFIPTDFGLRVPDPSAIATAAESAAAAEALAAAAGAASPPGESVPGPWVAAECPALRLWFKRDGRFGTPRAHASFCLALPPPTASVDGAIHAALYLRLLEDALTETSYAAEVAGLYASVSLTTCSVDIKVDGFHHKLPALVRAVFAQAASLAVQPARFALVREQLSRQLANAYVKPAKHATSLRLLLLRESAWPLAAQAAAAAAATPDSLSAFVPHLLAESHIEALVFGNVAPADAAALAGGVLWAMRGAAPLPPPRWPRDRVRRLATGPGLVIASPAANASEPNSVVESYYQGELDTPRSRAIADLAEQALSEPLYDTLRTKEQLGYSVGGGVRLSARTLGFCVHVTSSAYAPEHVDARIEAYLAGAASAIEALSPSDFAAHVSALTALKLQRDKALGDEHYRHWEAISGRRYDFHSREREAEALRGVTQADLVAWVRTFLDPASTTRRKLSVRVYGEGRHLPAPSAGGPSEPRVIVLGGPGDAAATAELLALRSSLGLEEGPFPEVLPTPGASALVAVPYDAN